MTCTNCETARTFPQYRLFNPVCLYCGARLIQSLGLLPIPVSECKTRRQAMLALWLSQGHNEAQIRELVKGPLAIAPIQSAPQTGPAVATACANPTPAKPRSRGRK